MQMTILFYRMWVTDGVANGDAYLLCTIEKMFMFILFMFCLFESWIEEIKLKTKIKTCPLVLF